jgi:hypothetical protein
MADLPIPTPAQALKIWESMTTVVIIEQVSRAPLVTADLCL